MTPQEPKRCKYGDKTCPCADGDQCHYEGKDAWQKPQAAANVLQEKSVHMPCPLCEAGTMFERFVCDNCEGVLISMGQYQRRSDFLDVKRSAPTSPPELAAARDSGFLVSEMLYALIRARGFIHNGVALGFIRMPDDDCPDPAHDTPKVIDAAIALAQSGATPPHPTAEGEAG